MMLPGRWVGATTVASRSGSASRRALLTAATPAAQAPALSSPVSGKSHPEAAAGPGDLELLEGVRVGAEAILRRVTGWPRHLDDRHSFVDQ